MSVNIDNGGRLSICHRKTKLLLEPPQTPLQTAFIKDPPNCITYITFFTSLFKHNVQKEK